MGSHGDVGISVGTKGVALQTPSWTPASASPATGWAPGWRGDLVSHTRALLSSGFAGKGLVPAGSERVICRDSRPRAGMEQTCLLTAALGSPSALSHAHKLSDPIPGMAQEYEAGCQPCRDLERGSGAGGSMRRGLSGCKSQLGDSGSHGAVAGGDTGHGAGQQGEHTLEGGWMFTKQVLG